ncbi:alpha/beta fold hydrolase [Prauserella cavernicola]|uniref:alpha/beta fold hydrolase n=1 Tax=Prauserella cavernicola TaxID=2800127 RepID=UPI0027DADFB8|nr:alpha/beta hydrolase [Prauserella cavernicola]
MIDGVRIDGDSGQAVLLLPGGAESCEGFFPGLSEGLLADPGCRVIVHDRPGTGSSAEEGSLADAAAHLDALIERLDCGPVVAVGQSLGGAVAALLARDHPDKVAGVVLLDATPINDPRACARLERVMRVVGPLAGAPGLRRAFSAAVRGSMSRTLRRSDLRPDCAAAHARIADTDIPTLARSVRGIGRLSAGFSEQDLPRLPSAVVTADRKPGDAIRRAHARLAYAFGAPLVCWPGATHSVHLDHPDDTLAVVRDVVSRVRAGERGSG